MLNFIICDDDTTSVRAIEKALEKIIARKEVPSEITLATSEPQKVLEYVDHAKMTTEVTNVYILDIDLNYKITGLEIARRIRKVDTLAYIIFITGHLEFAMLTYKYKIKAFEYLTKPVSFDDFSKCIADLMKDYNKLSSLMESDGNVYFPIKAGQIVHNVRINDIIYVEASGPKVIFHTPTAIIESYTSLTLVYNALCGMSENFFRIHRTYVINLLHIKEINYYSFYVVLDNNAKCPIARVKRGEIRKKLNYFKPSGDGLKKGEAK